VEGLGFNKAANKLILACKGSSNIEGHDKSKEIKAFYGFDLESKKLNTKPIFTISDISLLNFFQNMPREIKSISKEKKLVERLKSFSPSAIALHPVEQQYYILSSVGKLLIIVNKTGKLRSINFLDKDIFIQPEGICFAPEGTLYISNEGKSLVAKILKFKYLN